MYRRGKKQEKLPDAKIRGRKGLAPPTVPSTDELDESGYGCWHGTASSLRQCAVKHVEALGPSRLKLRIVSFERRAAGFRFVIFIYAPIS